MSDHEDVRQFFIRLRRIAWGCFILLLAVFSVVLIVTLTT